AAYGERVRALRDRDVIDDLEDLLVEQVVRRKLLGAKCDGAHGPAHVDADPHLGRLQRHGPLVVNRAVAYDQLVGQAVGKIGVQLAGRGVVLRHGRELVRAEAEPGVLIQRRVVVRGDVAGEGAVLIVVDDLADHQTVHGRDLEVDPAEQVPHRVVVVDHAGRPDVEVVRALHEVGDPRQAIERYGRGVGRGGGLAAQVVR